MNRKLKVPPRAGEDLIELPELSDGQAYTIFYSTPFLHVGVKDALKSKK